MQLKFRLPFAEQLPQRVCWFRTIHEVLEKHEIGRSAWSYREMNFGLSDARLDGVRDELIRYL